jgi:hypothetical protein
LRCSIVASQRRISRRHTTPAGEPSGECGLYHRSMAWKGKSLSPGGTPRRPSRRGEYGGSEPTPLSPAEIARAREVLQRDIRTAALQEAERRERDRRNLEAWMAARAAEGPQPGSSVGVPPDPPRNLAAIRQRAADSRSMGQSGRYEPRALVLARQRYLDAKTRDARESAAATLIDICRTSIRAAEAEIARLSAEHDDIVKRLFQRVGTNRPMVDDRRHPAMQDLATLSNQIAHRKRVVSRLKRELALFATR